MRTTFEILMYANDYIQQLLDTNSIDKSTYDYLIKMLDSDNLSEMHNTLRWITYERSCVLIEAFIDNAIAIKMSQIDVMDTLKTNQIGVVDTLITGTKTLWANPLIKLLFYATIVTIILKITG